MNCGAIPENLIESILFGHEKGSFTGATDKHLGKFQEADGGTLFLDEIGELRIDMQVKLLRALQEGEVDPVGSKRPVKVDVRIVSATNRDLAELTREGQFREDLYYRLTSSPSSFRRCVTVTRMCPRSHAHFIERFAAEEHKAVAGLTPEAADLLERFEWPGNVRQLENTIFRAVVLCDGAQLDVCDFPQIAAAMGIEARARRFVPEAAPIHAALPGRSVAQTMASPYALSAVDNTGHMRRLEDVESEMIRLAISRYDGHMSEVARRLGIGRSTLYRKLKELGLEPTESESGFADENPRKAGGLAAHSKRAEIEIEYRFLLLQVGLVELPHTHNLTHDLGVEARALRLGINLADVGGQCRTLFFQPLDAVDEGAQMFLGETRFGHFGPVLTKGADPSPRVQPHATRQ